MKKGPNPKAEPMPKASVTLWCDECEHVVAQYDLCTEHLATVLFAARKEHAKKAHDWHERTERLTESAGC